MQRNWLVLLFLVGFISLDAQWRSEPVSPPALAPAPGPARLTGNPSITNPAELVSLLGGRGCSRGRGEKPGYRRSLPRGKWSPGYAHELRRWLENGPRDVLIQPTRAGARIQYRDPDNFFHHLGILSGDIIVAINGHRLTPELLGDPLRTSSQLRFSLLRQGRRLEVKVDLEP